MNLQIEISNEKELDVCVETLSKYFLNVVQRENIKHYPCYINLHKKTHLENYEIIENLHKVSHYTYIHSTFRNFWNAYLDYLDTPIIKSNKNSKNSKKLLTARYSNMWAW